MSTAGETTPQQIRETSVKTEQAPLSRRTVNPTRVFVDKDRTAFLWFCVAVLAIIFAAAQPYFLIQGTSGNLISAERAFTEDKKEAERRNETLPEDRKRRRTIQRD